MPIESRYRRRPPRSGAGHGIRRHGGGSWWAQTLRRIGLQPLLLCGLLLTSAAALAQDSDTGGTEEAKDAKGAGTSAPAPTSPTTLPPRFVPKETISPDSVISFPADI